MFLITYIMFPQVRNVSYLLLLTYNAFFTVIDLKSFLYFRHSSRIKQIGMANEYWQNNIFPNHGFFTYE